MGKQRVIFTVQGDGRGHLTQALAARKICADAGMDVSCVVVGHSPRRVIPQFFKDKINAPVLELESLDLIADKANRGISPARTVVGNAMRMSHLYQAFGRLVNLLKTEKPDVVLNFFEPMTGLVFRLARPKARLVCVGHQYLLEHPQFPFPPGRDIDKRLLQSYCHITTAPHSRKLALSFRPMPDLYGNLKVMPPLLREEVLNRPFAPSEDFFLVYLLKSGYQREIREWHQHNPGQVLHCFTDQPQPTPEVKVNETLYFHSLSDEKFLNLMSRCKGMMSTSGFESVCEAMWFGKPVFAVPVENHYEQLCNGYDMQASGAGIWNAKLEPDKFLSYLPTHQTNPEPTRQWFRQAGPILVDALTNRT